jgi:cytidylate kinase
MPERGFVVAVDGPSGVGKSSASRGLARRLRFRHVDTGAMYRAVALLAADRGIPPTDADALADVARGLEMEFRELGDGTVRVLVGGRDVTDDIRRPEIGALASAVSAQPGVRRHLVEAQRAMAEGCDVVMEGRDIGTVVFPDAPVKFFLTADQGARAERRLRELRQRGLEADREQVQSEQAERDRRDSSRAHAPLREAGDAIVLDTTRMTLDEVILAMARVVGERRPGSGTS